MSGNRSTEEDEGKGNDRSSKSDRQDEGENSGLKETKKKPNQYTGNPTKEFILRMCAGIHIPRA